MIAMMLLENYCTIIGSTSLTLTQSDSAESPPLPSLLNLLAIAPVVLGQSSADACVLVILSMLPLCFRSACAAHRFSSVAASGLVPRIHTAVCPGQYTLTVEQPDLRQLRRSLCIQAASKPRRMANSKYEYVKLYEQPDPLLPGCWIVVRVDGKGFTRCAAIDMQH
jgi:hypothetical protein